MITKFNTKQSSSSVEKSGQDNTAIAVLVGVGLLIAGVYFWNQYQKRQEEKAAQDSKETA